MVTMAARSYAHGQQPWQKIQIPTASETAMRWKAPPPEYGPEVYYGLNGTIDETMIQHDMDQMKAMGYQAVTLQAGRDMPAAYLSEGYFKLLRVFLEEAKKRGMRVWLVDEAGYPSGFAGGKFTLTADSLHPCNVAAHAAKLLQALGLAHVELELQLEELIVEIALLMAKLIVGQVAYFF